VCNERSESRVKYVLITYRGVTLPLSSQCMYARVNGCMNELKVVHEVGTTEVCEVSPTKTLRGKPATAGISPGKS